MSGRRGFSRWLAEDGSVKEEGEQRGDLKEGGVRGRRVEEVREEEWEGEGYGEGEESREEDEGVEPGEGGGALWVQNRQRSS